MKRFFALVVMIAMLIAATAAGEAMNMPKMDNFTPSVSGKPAPEIVIRQALDGSLFAAIIRNLRTGLEMLVPDKDFIVVAAVAGWESVQDEIVRQRLKTAFETIMGVENVGDLLVAADEEMALNEEPLSMAELLDKRLQEMDAELTHEDLVIKDLFDLSIQGSYSDLLSDEDSEMEVSFADSADPEKPFVAVFSENGMHWKVISADDTDVSEKGTVILKLRHQGVAAFLVGREEMIDSKTAVQSPN